MSLTRNLRKFVLRVKQVEADVEKEERVVDHYNMRRPKNALDPKKINLFFEELISHLNEIKQE